MGEGYGCSNFQCSPNAIQIKDDTPIFNRQVTKEKLHVLYTTVGSPCMLYM